MTEFREFGHKKENSDITLCASDREFGHKGENSDITLCASAREFGHKDENSDITCCPSAMISSDERIRDFKKMQQIHDSGLEVEYRCPKCRECQDCKDADRTEKISLREESERYEIQKSVHLDLENKKFQCSLPLMGRERDYLTSNRERALRILMQQCKKYHKDTETKNLILEAFKKLFDNGHAMLLSDLAPQQKSFLSKEIQYHIPWRVVFSNSPTTPTRPVLDASSRTSFRHDKTGGRSQ